MNKATEKLSRIFKLEAQQGFENRAVMGGMVRLTQAWESDAREVAMDETTIQFVSQKFSVYEQLNPAERKTALIEIAEQLAIQETLNLQAFAVSETLADFSQAVSAENGSQSANLNARSHLSKSLPTNISTSTQRARTKSPVSAARPTHQAGASSSVSSARVGTKSAGAKTTPAPRFGIEAPVTVIRGIGDKQAENLSRLGVYKIKDLLNLFPRRYDDYSKLKTINMLYIGDEVTIIAKVVSSSMYPVSRGRKIVEVIVSDTTGNLRLMWFNQTWILKTLREGMFISISGKVENYMGRLVIMHPEFEALDQQQLNTNRIVPVYPLTANVTQKWLRRLQFNTVNYWSPKIHEFMPAKVQEKGKLIQLPEAYSQIHFPDDEASLKAAQHRFAFDEIFLIQLGVIQQKRYWQTLTGRGWTVSDVWLKDRLASLPYELTGAQTRTVREIRQDLAQTHPMNRLLQGDVGSG
ncbi:MAG TPA: OB-fold nucleic acid binding domain-containing protein, partial [Anaerolineaceae bacterium]|nr:OB-fold nucleic acid binding domain-containing protein [Anaerolineaceae bacterium]